jgi:Protein of unknown function (DUF3071)
MQELRLVAVSEDGTYAVLAVPGRGGRFSLPIDDRLRTVARGQFSRLAQYEIEVENPLRPKEIQDRIRAGETAEEIADVAGIPIDRVRRFEGPVLAEREYRAQEAQRSTVRGHTESGPGPRLGEIVLERLADAGSSPDSQDWDSRKRADGNWQVQLQFIVDGRPQVAEWVFDPRRRHVIPADDTARRLSLPQVDWPAGRLGSLGTQTATVTPIGSRLGAHQADLRPEPDRALARGAAAAPAQRPYQPGSYQPAEPPRAPAEPPRPREAAHAREAALGREAERRAPAERDVVAAATAPATAANAASGAPSVPAAFGQVPPASATAAAAPGAAAPAAAAAPGQATAGRGTHAAAPSAVPSSASATAPAQATLPEDSPAPGAAAMAGTAAAAARDDGQPAADDAQPAAEPRTQGRSGRKAAGGKGRRSSVPSWDEIMLGNSRQPD